MGGSLESAIFSSPPEGGFVTVLVAWAAGEAAVPPVVAGLALASELELPVAVELPVPEVAAVVAGAFDPEPPHAASSALVPAMADAEPSTTKRRRDSRDAMLDPSPRIRPATGRSRAFRPG